MKYEENEEVFSTVFKAFLSKFILSREAYYYYFKYQKSLYLNTIIFEQYLTRLLYIVCYIEWFAKGLKENVFKFSNFFYTEGDANFCFKKTVNKKII